MGTKRTTRIKNEVHEHARQFVFARGVNYNCSETLKRDAVKFAVELTEALETEIKKSFKKKEYVRRPPAIGLRR